MTTDFMNRMEDYFSHMVLHENQVIRIMEFNRA
jgi:hypothetical protein